MYFKTSHFKGMHGHSPRELHDADLERLGELSWDELANGDPFTTLLKDRAGRIPNGEPTSLVDRWERAESTLNARLRAIVGLAGPVLPVAITKLLTGEDQVLPAMEVAAGRNPIDGKRRDGVFGQPDLVLVGADAAMSMEMKFRGGGAAASYDPSQHAKYLLLAEALRQKYGLQLVHHLLLAPFGDGRIVTRAEKWLQGPVCGGQPIDPIVEGLLAGLSPRQRGLLLADGGMPRVADLTARMPTRAVDLGELLAAFDSMPCTDPAVAGMMRGQVEAVRRYGMRGTARVASDEL